MCLGVGGTLIKRARKAVLLVEDDPKRRQYFYEALKLTNVDLYSAQNGDQAMQIVRRDRPELILLNLFSSGADGLAFLQLLRSFAAGRNIVVLGMVGDEDEELHEIASQAGADKLLEREPPLFFIIELVLGFLKIEQIEVPDTRQADVGMAEIKAAPEEALQASPATPGKVQPIAKSGQLLLSDKTGRDRR